MLLRIGLAGLIISAAPASAVAQECGGLRSVLDMDNQGFAGVSWRMAPRRGVSLDARAGRVDLPGAQECTLLNDAEGSSELSCQWDYVAQADATAGYDRLLARTRGCLGADAMQSEPVLQNASGWRPVQANVQTIEREGGAETQIKLELVEYIAPVPDGTAPSPPRYFVTLRVSRDEE